MQLLLEARADACLMSSGGAHPTCGQKAWFTQRTQHDHTRSTRANKCLLAILDMSIELDDEWPESIFHHVGSQSASYLLSVL